jgi:hypothetical protein
MAANARVDENLKKHVLNIMKKGDIYDTLISDHLILMFGAALLKRVGAKGHRRISARMRQLASLLLTLKNVVDMPDASLSDFLTGQYYDAVVEATETMSGAKFNEQGHRVFDKPSLVTSTGNLITKCCELRRGHAIKTVDDQEVDEVDRFSILFKAFWADTI